MDRYVLYGELNNATTKVIYEGVDTETVDIRVDNSENKISANVLKVPNSFVIRDTLKSLYNSFNGSTSTLTDLSVYNYTLKAINETTVGLYRYNDIDNDFTELVSSVKVGKDEDVGDTIQSISTGITTSLDIAQGTTFNGAQIGDPYIRIKILRENVNIYIYGSLKEAFTNISSEINSKLSIDDVMTDEFIDSLFI